jgi:ATP-dependent Lhr-like helicase
MTEAEIKSSLPRTWMPFFSRFGRLTPVQVQTIPVILKGENVVVISPSASGKTEAVVAPVVERLLPAAPGRLTVLYVSPTRALVNDLYRRLSEPLDYLRLPLARKTGDHPTIEEDRLPFLLITTPESLDSLLCRRTAIFSHLSTVILDELHLLDNTPRGDQLRVLLERLRRVRKGLRFHALSATIGDRKIGERYFPGGQVVQVAESRKIDYLLLPEKGDYIGRVYAELQKRGLKKVLVFFNARSFVEMYSRSLDRPPFAGKVWAHHASLTKRERENAERLMLSERRGVLCATSTLELGIDIGDIDAVVLFRPPFSISSLLQRIGRGNRRSGQDIFTIGIYLNSWEKLLFEMFFECGRKGELYEKRYTPCRAVLPQQVVSYLYQRRRIGTTFDALSRVLAPIASAGTAREAFRELAIQGNIVETRPGIFQVGPALEREVRLGKIHSNIQEKSFGDFEVMDCESGASIGRVFFLFNRFVLAGRTWEVVERREKEKRVYVRSVGRSAATSKVFEGTGTGGYFYRFAARLKSELFPGLAENEFPYYRDSGEIHLYHFLGELYGGILSAALGETGLELNDVGGRLFTWSEKKRRMRNRQNDFPVPAIGDVRSVIKRQLAVLEDRLGSGAFFRLLPEHLQIDDHLLALDIDGLLRFLRGVVVVEVPAPSAHS